MPNPFVEGFRQARQDNEQERQNALLRERERLEIDELAAANEQRALDRQRRNAAFEANEERFGAIAGDPTSTGQLAGIEQRQILFDNGQEDREEARARQAFTAAIGSVRQTVNNGGSATQALLSLPPAFREAQNITDEIAAELGTLIDSDPAALDAIEASLQGPQNPELQEGRGPDGKPVFFRVGADGVPEIVEGVTPGSSSSQNNVNIPGASGLSRRPDGTVVDAEGNVLTQAQVNAAVAAQAGVTSQTRTTAREIAQADVSAIEALPGLQDNARTLRERISRVRSNPNARLVTGQVSIDKILSGGVGGLVELGVPGTEAANVLADIQAIQSQAFTQAFESLKGGGPITETEGTAATNALSDLRTARTTAEFYERLDTFDQRVADLIAAKEQRARAATERTGNFASPTQTAPRRISLDDFLSGN